MSSTNIHPDAVLDSLLDKGSRANRKANLTKVHELCRKEHANGSRDFSLPTIGRLIEADGILKGRALYNAQSADYRVLIEAWGAYAGPPQPKPTKTLASADYLMRIEDPAIRSIMQAIVAERDKLRAQVNLLKAHAQVTIDRRPLGATVSSTGNGQTVTVLSMTAQLTPSEQEALKKSISPAFLEERGMHEGSHGEIKNESGRTIFDVGFGRAVRKILGQ